MVTATATTDELVGRFLRHLSDRDRGASANTISAYETDLRQLKTFLWGMSGATNWQGVTKEDILQFIEHLKTKVKPLAEASISRKASVVSSFFEFLFAEGLVKSDPAYELDLPRVTKTKPNILSVGQMATLLEQPAKQETPAALRDAAMIELLYATGIRNTELVFLNLDSISVKRKSQSVDVTRKGAKQRTVPMHKQAVHALTEYLRDGRPELSRDKQEQALFLNHRGNRMARQGLLRLLQQHVKDARIDGLVTTDTIRASFKAHMLAGGATKEQVNSLLGLASQGTTEELKATSEAAQRVYEKAHPRAG